MKHELLAPAGDISAAYSALHYGADAIYLGLNKFSARYGATNFTFDELEEICCYAHSINKKVFVALNTILTQEEINDLPLMFKAIDKAKVDALIIQDLGVLYLAKKLLPNIELHASTQMAIHNLEGAKYLQSLGFKRVVLARELTLKEIKEISSQLPTLDLEVFVHGALCYSYSGQCLFSALEYGKSANRGRCVYPCRSIFDVTEANTNSHFKSHLFSMKDMAIEELVKEIPALSLKIEGRKKSDLYVASVTNYYRQILDNQKNLEENKEDIKQIFSRPWCKFHINGKTKDITDENFVGHRGLLISKVQKVNKNTLTFKTNHQISRYDGIQIDIDGTEKPYGFGIQAIYVNKKSVFSAPANTTVEVEIPTDHPFIKENAPIYLASSTAVKGKYDYFVPKKGEYKIKYDIDVNIEVYPNKIWAMCEDKAVSIDGDFEIAKNKDNLDKSIISAFNKTGDTNFNLHEINIKNNDQRFVPISKLNELRRNLFNIIEIKEVEFILPSTPKYIHPHPSTDISSYEISLDTKKEELSKLDLTNLWLVLPQICRNTKAIKNIISTAYTLGARKFIAQNYYVFEILKPYTDVEIAAGDFIYTLNSYATAQLKEMGASFATLALESSPNNMIEVVNNSSLPIIQVIQKTPPLFTSAVCIRRNDCSTCKGGIKKYILKKDGKTFIGISKDCQVQIFNQKQYTSQPIEGVAHLLKEEFKYG